MRANLEDNIAHRVRHSSSTFGSLQTTLIGPFRITRDGPSFYFLNTNGADRDLFLPPREPGGGQLYVIAHTGTVGNLTIRDDGGLGIKTVAPGSVNIVISSVDVWHIAPFSSLGPGGTGVESTGPFDPTMLAGFADTSGQLIRGVSVGTGLAMSGGVTPQLQLDPDLASLAGAATTDAIYYKKPDASWGPVTIDAATMNFTGGVLKATVANLGSDAPADGSVYGRRNNAWFAAQPLDPDLTSLAASTSNGTIYFKRSSGDWAPVIVGTGLSFDPVAGDLEATGGASGTGDVTASDDPVANQLALWIGPTTIKGINIGTGLALQSVGPVQSLVSQANVSSVGTPLGGQIGRWTGATTLEGVDASALGFAPINSPVFTGDPQAPTPATADNDTSIATTAFVKAQNYALAADLGNYALINSPTFLGDPKAPTPAPGDNDTSIATTAFVAASYAPLNSPVFTGDARAVTPPTTDNDTSIATTAFVRNAMASFSSAVTISDTPPLTPKQGDLWWESDTGRMFINYDDGTSSQWVSATALAAGVTSVNTLMEDITIVGAGGVTVTQNVGTKTITITGPSADFGTGDTKLTYSNVPLPGWILVNDGSIGNAASGGTTRANADTENLFVMMYNNIPTLVLQTSAGAPIARGASAAADFAANRRLVLPKALGRAMGVAGNGAGITGRGLGSSLGNETHTLATTELTNHAHTHNTTHIHGHSTAHSHGVSDPSHLHPLINQDTMITGLVVDTSAIGGGGGYTATPANVTTNAAFTGISIGAASPGNTDAASPGSTDAQGGGAPFDIMNPTTFLNLMIKL